MNKASKFQERVEHLQNSIKANQIHNENIITEPQILMDKLCSIAVLKNVARGRLV